MSEKNHDKAAKSAAPETKDTKETKKDGGKEKSGNVVKAKEVVKRERTTWTLARCLKYARRFADEATWASAAPSSYKSAMAHGWREQCLTAQTTGGKVLTGRFPKKTDATTPGKRAA